MKFCGNVILPVEDGFLNYDRFNKLSYIGAQIRVN